MRFDLLESILLDSKFWESRDFDQDLKKISLSLAVDICTFKDLEDEGEQARAMKMLVNNDRICSALKKSILARNKSEQARFHSRSNISSVLVGMFYD